MKSKKKTKQKHHIFVATPMYGGMCAGFYTQSIIQFQKLFTDMNIDVSFSFMFNESLITRARNGLTQTFLKSPATHLMFIDADIKFHPEQIPSMIDADKDIICGIYPKKEINWKSVREAIYKGIPDDELRYHTGSFVVNLVGYSDNVTVPINKPLEIWNGGTGFMLIKRKVFEKLSNIVPNYINNILDLSKSLKKEEIKEYFSTSIDEEIKILMSEDYHFCKLARDNGIKVWAAPWVQLSHLGSYLFEGKLTPSS